ncbi:MAG: hypothetical protein KBT02_05260 [Treponema sp.]|nr:hypothetical protein [Candidatus Treponema caballi]
MKKKIILSLIALLTVTVLITGCSLLDGMFQTNIDGTWIGSNKATGKCTEYTVKMVISGNTVKWYDATAAYKAAVLMWSEGDDEPTAAWESEPAYTGTVSVSDNTITFSFLGVNTTGTLAKDKKSFTYKVGTHTDTFKKQ